MPDTNATPKRELPGTAKKVLVVGFDGATWDVFEPLMQQGLMPNLKAFVEEGTSGPLWSTIPPITPAAWTTFMTGKSPGTHGIIDFERYDVKTNKLMFNTTNALQHVRSIWQILGDRDFKVGCVSVPMTYPPTPVNGFLISGFGTPDTDRDFTWPMDLRKEVLEVCPTYHFEDKWKHARLRPRKVFNENVDGMVRSFFDGYTLTKHFGDKFGWDAMMVVLKLVDNLQHKTWRFIDPRWQSRRPARTRKVFEAFSQLDKAFGQMVEYANQHEATVFVMSDHGHGSLEGQSQPNYMLHDWGYLTLKEGTTPGKRGLFGKKKSGKHYTGAFSIERDLAVDFSKTKACVMHAGMSGFLYLNLKGRQETGIVPADQYESLRDELRQRFLDVETTDRSGKTVKVYKAVHKPEEVYGCSREGREWLPDLLLMPTDGISVIRKIKTAAPVRWFSWRRTEGTHRDNGMFAVKGPGIAAGKKLEANIIDSTPTILAMLGVPIPEDMEGKVIEDVFENPIEYKMEAASGDGQMKDPSEAYSEDEQKLIAERLQDLGYLE